MVQRLHGLEAYFHLVHCSGEFVEELLLSTLEGKLRFLEQLCLSFCVSINVVVLIGNLQYFKECVLSNQKRISAWLLIGFAQNIWMVYAARAIAGFSIGVASLSLPVYLAETLQPEVRGVLGLLPTCIGNIGILINYTAGSYFVWDHLALLGAILSVPFLVCMCFIPETPRWYIAKGREECAEKALQWLRGRDTDIRSEMSEIRNSHLLTKKYSTKLTDLFSKTYRKSILASLGLMFFQQFSGINAVIFYTVNIFEMSKSSIDSNLSTIVVGLVNFGAVFVATLLIDRLGRKVLLLISDVLMIFCLGVLGTFFYLNEHHTESVEHMGWIPLASFMLFVTAFSLGFGPIRKLLLVNQLFHPATSESS